MPLPVSFNPLGGSWTLVFVLLAALAAGVLTLTPRSRSLSIRRKRVETGLRLLFIPLFAILFARPSVVVTEVEELPATIALLCDVSESMTVEDGPEGQSRYDAMRSTLEASRSTLRELGEKFDVRVIGFSDTSEELTFEDGVAGLPEKASGQETRVGDALAETLRATAGKRLLSVALLSDGAQRVRDPDATTPQDVALRYRDAERAVTVVPFGSSTGSSSVRDLAIADLRANERVFVGNELVVSGQLRASGFANVEIPVTFELETAPGEMTVVGKTTLTPKSDETSIPWQFVCKPNTAGEWKLRVSTPVVEGKELLETNNELSAFVEAIDGGVRALYVEGTRRYEQNFLRAALDSSSDVLVRYWRPPVSSLVAKFPNKTEAELVSTLTKSRKPLVDTFFSEGKYATYILGDTDATAFQPEELQALADLVEAGAGLIVLAGERSLSLGGYAETALKDALPVETLKTGRLPLDADLSEYESSSTSGDHARLFGEYRAVPTEDALESRDAFAISLSVDQKKNLETWQSLPPLSSVYPLGRVKLNATTLLLAQSTKGKSDAGYPLLVTQQYGLGRVAVVATDSTWRWRMRGKEAEHAKFWRQLVLWSAKTDELLEGELAIETDSSRFAPGDPVEFSVVYRPKEGESLDQVRAEAYINAPDGTREKISLTKEQEGIWRGVGGAASVVGDYQIEASLVSESEDALQTARTRFLVYEKNLELERPGAALDVLDALAATTQGKTVAPGEFQSYLESLLEERATIVDEHDAKISCYDSWFLFLAFVFLAAADWVLRRRWGLA